MFFLVVGRYDKIGRDWCSGILRSVSKRLKAVTFESGFGSVSRLKALFRERYGMNMREWRKLHRK